MPSVGWYIGSISIISVGIACLEVAVVLRFWTLLLHSYLDAAHRASQLVIGIFSVTDKIREYPLSDVFDPIHISIGDQSTHVADVQPALDSLAVVGGPTRRA